jgi:endonuclease/exonuclease/phosphatase family metal-dependent hydrolase
MPLQRTMTSFWFALVFVCMGIVGTPLHAQLRVVTYNTLDNPTSSGEFPAWNVVLDAIGNESIGGIAQRIGVMGLQEVDVSGASAQNIAGLLNDLYDVSSYQVATAPYGDGYNLQSFVYDDSQVELLDTQVFAMGTRPGWRGHFRPVGYDDNPDAEFYLYSVHLKAYAESVEQRGVEAARLRMNGDALGPDANIIYAGDFNLTSGGSEPAYANMLASGNGQAVDPENGDFTDPLKMSYSSSGAGSRIDFQFISTEMADEEGLDLIDGNYRVFHREYLSGTSRLVTAPTELISASDHLPVVADYQLPAVLQVVADSVPATLVQGDTCNLEFMVNNVAFVVAANGADELDYSLNIVGEVGSLIGAPTGTDQALGSGNLHQLALDTSTPGVKSGSIVISSSSPGVANGTVSIDVVFEVITAGIAGDYNDDGTVDAADYTVWRDTLEASGTSLPNDPTPGTVDESDYLYWRTHFGESAGSGVGAGSLAEVPEPAGLILILVAMFAILSAAGLRRHGLRRP